MYYASDIKVMRKMVELLAFFSICIKDGKRKFDYEFFDKHCNENYSNKEKKAIKRWFYTSLRDFGNTENEKKFEMFCSLINIDGYLTIDNYKY